MPNYKAGLVFYDFVIQLALYREFTG
jgi:hypothetical protein